MCLIIRESSTLQMLYLVSFGVLSIRVKSWCLNLRWTKRYHRDVLSSHEVASEVVIEFAILAGSRQKMNQNCRFPNGWAVRFMTDWVARKTALSIRRLDAKGRQYEISASLRYYHRDQPDQRSETAWKVDEIGEISTNRTKCLQV